MTTCLGVHPTLGSSGEAKGRVERPKAWHVAVRTQITKMGCARTQVSFARPGGMRHPVAGMVTAGMPG